MIHKAINRNFHAGAKIFALLLLLLFILGACQSQIASLKPDKLTCEYIENPLGIDILNPRLSWTLLSKERNQEQSAYELIVSDNIDAVVQLDGNMWATGKITSSGGQHIIYKGLPLKSFQRYYWRVRVYDQNNRPSPWSKLAWFETAMLSGTDWQAQWITDGYDKEYDPAPLFRRDFELAEKQIISARAYVSAAGYYEMFINGERVGTYYLDPGYTDYSKRILYTTHDVTSLLKPGENTVAAVLGNGWYNLQNKVVWNFHEGFWRKRPRLLAELHIRYADGTKEIIATDSSWKTSTGAYVYNDIYSGDCVDLRLEEIGWKEPSFDDTHWKQAKEVPAPCPNLVAQQMPGIRITEELKASDMKKYSDQLYVYTFPKNMAGFCRLRVKGGPGTRITLKHGELLKKDGRLEQGNVDMFLTPKRQGEAFQQDEVVLRDAGEWVEFMPSYTYHGFQYVEVESSKPIDLTRESLTALFVHTDVKPVGSFECSSQVLNKIWEASRQSYLSNLESIPTDCPQREKNGWTGDAQFSVDLGLLNFDGINFYKKWLDDIIDNQQEEGDITSIIPSSGWGSGQGPVWDAAMLIIPDALYHYYGDSQYIQKMIPVTDRYLAYLGKQEKDGLITYGLGDWVSYKSWTNQIYTSTAYYYLCYKLRASFARISGEDANKFLTKAEKIRKTINKHFFNAESGTYAKGTQTAQALALYLGLPPKGKEKQVAEKLHELVAGNNYFPDFGVIGSKTVPRMLTKYGYVEDAMKMVTKTEIPSWGYWVEKLGRTTLEESWKRESIGEFGSLNHVFLGDVSAWMVNQLGGINYAPENPGFTHILITPHFVKDLSWVKAQYQSVKGLISSEWKRENGKVLLKVTVPAGCRATIITGEGEDTVNGGDYEFEYE